MYCAPNLCSQALSAELQPCTIRTSASVHINCYLYPCPLGHQANTELIIMRCNLTLYGVLAVCVRRSRTLQTRESQAMPEPVLDAQFQS